MTTATTFCRTRQNAEKQQQSGVYTRREREITTTTAAAATRARFSNRRRAARATIKLGVVCPRRWFVWPGAVLKNAARVHRSRPRPVCRDSRHAEGVRLHDAYAPSSTVSTAADRSRPPIRQPLPPPPPATAADASHAVGPPTIANRIRSPSPPLPPQG